MKKGMHPVLMLLLVAGAALFGLLLPTWTLSLATIAASNALIALGIVILARTGNVSFGQGLFYAAGGYGVALIANRWGITDAVAQMFIGAGCAGLLGVLIGPLLARYSGIFFGMLTLALSMVLYGALVKTTALGGSDGFNIGRPTLFGMSFIETREADFMLYAVSVVTTGLAGVAATVLFRSELGLASLAVRENNLRVEYLGISSSLVITINFAIAAHFRRSQRRVCSDGATPHRSTIRLLDHVGGIRVCRCARGISERGCRFRRLARPRTGSFILEPVPSEHLAAGAGRFPACGHPVSAARHWLALDPEATQ